MSSRAFSKKVRIAPSLLAVDFARLKEQVAQVEEGSADWLHVDVMDGVFVPNLSFGAKVIETCRAISKLPLDVHLMVVDPEKYFDTFAKAGASVLTIHVETAPHILSLLPSLGFILHSTLDGVAIGLGFARSPELGLLVGMAVIAHDFADGMNVVTRVLRARQGVRPALILLVLDALAPAFGVLGSSLISVSPVALGFLLVGFAGVFLSIGATHLLPEAQHGHPGPAPRRVLAGIGLC